MGHTFLDHAIVHLTHIRGGPDVHFMRCHFLGITFTWRVKGFYGRKNYSGNGRLTAARTMVNIGVLVRVRFTACYRRSAAYRRSCKLRQKGVTPVENLPKNILVTAFDAFGGEKINPTELILGKLPEQICGAKLIKQLLPTSYDRAPVILCEKIAEACPDVIIMLGQAGGRRGVTPERIAINCQDAKIADNDGVMYRNVPIYADGREAYFATLPVSMLADRLTDAGIPSYVSNSAGTFVCNRVMYEALRLTCGTGTKAGFVHIPYIPEQTEDKPDGTPSLPLDDAERAVEVLIKALLSNAT